MGTVTVREYTAGEASYIAYLQMRFYAEAHGFKGVFEYYLLASLAEFVISGVGSRLWVAADGENIVGSVAIVQSESSVAKLRWFIVSPAYQGEGVGKKLLDTAMQFCREQGYTHVFLWTFQELETARYLYKKYGFVQTEQKPNTEWTDRQLTEERWDLFL
jgi:N-acetylglutamate synthase and related acetyltransferases